jgi:hypothetical protein
VLKCCCTCKSSGFPTPGSAGRYLQRGQVQRAAAARVAGLYVGARGKQLAQHVQAAGARPSYYFTL